MLFGLFKKRVDGRRVCSDLAATAKELIALEPLVDFEIALEGSRLLRKVARTSEEVHGVRVDPESIFAGFFKLCDKRDLLAMSKEIRKFIIYLRRKDSTSERGRLMYFWMTRERLEFK